MDWLPKNGIERALIVEGLCEVSISVSKANMPKLEELRPLMAASIYLTIKRLPFWKCWGFKFPDFYPKIIFLIDWK